MPTLVRGQDPVGGGAQREKTKEKKVGLAYFTLAAATMVGGLFAPGRGLNLTAQLSLSSCFIRLSTRGQVKLCRQTRGRCRLD